MACSNTSVSLSLHKHLTISTVAQHQMKLQKDMAWEAEADREVRVMSMQPKLQ